MADLNHVRIEDIEQVSGFFEKVSLRKAASGIDLSAFGMSIVEMGPGADEYPEHDHSPDGLGGRMFEKRPDQLGQEEVYVALRGSGTLEAEGERYPLDPEHIVRVGPGVTRHVTAGRDGLRLLAIGATPGEPYGTGETG